MTIVGGLSDFLLARKATPNLDPLGSPHLEENLIGAKVDLDILS